MFGGRLESGLDYKMSKLTCHGLNVCVVLPPPQQNSYGKALIREDAKDPPVEKSFQESRVMVEEI